MFDDLIADVLKTHEAHEAASKRVAELKAQYDSSLVIEETAKRNYEVAAGLLLGAIVGHKSKSRIGF